MERSAIAPRFQLIVRTTRILKSAVLGDQHEGVQRAVARGNTRQCVAR